MAQSRDVFVSYNVLVTHCVYVKTPVHILFSIDWCRCNPILSHDMQSLRKMLILYNFATKKQHTGVGPSHTNLPLDSSDL